MKVLFELSFMETKKFLQSHNVKDHLAEAIHFLQFSIAPSPGLYVGI